MRSMKKRTIKISKDQKLSQVYPLIDTNIILNKKLSGVGATHCEIIAPRHSIIVVPNIPIITCKVEKHKDSDNLFGVMANVSVRDIEQYIETTLSMNKRIKIMVTPESFRNVRKAFNEVEFDMYNNCFLMLDECHKFIKERDFRREIVQPLHSFFKFKNKALVSATPIIPSDPRFAEQHFEIVEVVPDYKHLFKLVVIPTNNIRRAFYDDTNRVRNRHLPPEPQCVFVNSASMIADLINQSGLQEISSIFCSDKSAVKLRQMGFKNVHTEWKSEYENHYMFFTSRFFTGLDIWLDTKPRVLYLSDAENAEHTLMDPKTDMAQACGRFRNDMKEIFHYVVFNPSIERRTKEDIDEYVNGIIKSHKALQQVYERTNSKFEKQAILSALESLPFKEIFFEDEIDYFLKDNITDFEQLKQCYRDFFSLQEAYGSSGYFFIPDEDPHFYPEQSFELENIKRLSAKEIRIQQRKAIIETLDHIAPYRKTPTINEIIYTLKDFDRLFVDAFFVLGKTFVEQCDYNPKIIKEELLNRKNAKLSPDEAFFNTLYSTFEIGKKYTLPYAKKELKRIYDKFLLTPPSTITAKSLRWHFEIDDKARIGNQKAVKILRRKADGISFYYDKVVDNTKTQPLSDFED
mgnify:CR=1 FL=1